MTNIDNFPHLQATSSIVSCTGRHGWFDGNPVQAVVMMVPISDGSWKKMVTCCKKEDCVGMGIVGYCILER